MQYSDFESLAFNRYGRTKTQIFNTKDAFSKKAKGIKCH